MFRISAAEFFPYLEIGIFPKTPQVGGQLYTLVSGGEQVHHHRNPAVVHPRGVKQAETFLETHTDHRDIISNAVFHLYPAACGHGDMGGHNAVHGLLLVVIQFVLDFLAEIYAAEFGHRGCIPCECWQPF